jgi:hypothetical protein
MVGLDLKQVLVLDVDRVLSKDDLEILEAKVVDDKKDYLFYYNSTKSSRSHSKNQQVCEHFSNLMTLMILILWMFINLQE